MENKYFEAVQHRAARAFETAGWKPALFPKKFELAVFRKYGVKYNHNPDIHARYIFEGCYDKAAVITFYKDGNYSIHIDPRPGINIYPELQSAITLQLRAIRYMNYTKEVEQND